MRQYKLALYHNLWYIMQLLENEMQFYYKYIDLYNQ